MYFTSGTFNQGIAGMDLLLSLSIERLENEQLLPVLGLEFCFLYRGLAALRMLDRFHGLSHPRSVNTTTL